MRRNAALQGGLARLLRASGASTVLVFGSTADQSATPDSDIDLLVAGIDRQSVLDLGLKLAGPLAADIHCYPLDAISEHTDPTFADTVLRQAIPLFEDGRIRRRGWKRVRTHPAIAKDLTT